MRQWAAATLISLTLALPPASGAQAESVADFYRGKTVTLIVGYSAGGGYDIYAQQWRLT